MELAGLLYVEDDLDGVRALADAGVEYAATYLAEMLADRGDLAGLRILAGADGHAAAWQLGRLLAERGGGDLDELRALVDVGDEHTARILTDLLADRGDLKIAEQFLRARADLGYGDAQRLAELLSKQGRNEEAARLRRFGLNPDGSIAVT